MGWYLTLVDTVCKEYGSVSPSDIKLRIPLAEAFAYYGAIVARRSGGDSPDYEALELIDALSAMEGSLS